MSDMTIKALIVRCAAEIEKFIVANTVQFEVVVYI